MYTKTRVVPLNKERNYVPVLPIDFISNYYLVEINFQNFFTDLGIPYSGPNGPARIIASNFKITKNANPKDSLFVQGKPGVMVKDVDAAYYTYTIEAPLITNNYFYPGPSNFLPYNSLNYLALKLANWQWQQIHGYSTTTLDANDLYVVVKSYNINVTGSTTTQTLVIESNILLGDNNIGGLQIEAFTIDRLAIIDPSAYNDVSRYIGRLIKNYDLFVNMDIQIIEESGPQPPFSLITGTPSLPNNIYLDTTSFEIAFDVEQKVFLNYNSVVTFLVKNYTLAQKYGIVGQEQSLIVPNYEPGEFYETLTQSSLYIAGNLLIKYQAPMIVGSKTNTLAQSSLVNTDIDFSMYGANYSPGNSPFGVYDLFQSEIA